VTELIGEFLARNQPWLPAIDGNWWVAPELIGERESASPPR
jgi:hypothetical protein